MKHARITLRRRGFTLMELLVVALIISILASIALFAMFNAAETGRRARTRAQVERIQGLIMPIWESFRTRRVPINTAGLDPTTAAGRRLDGIRYLLRAELPERKSDVDVGDGPHSIKKPARSEGYKAKAAALGAWSTQHESSECLYLILSYLFEDDQNAMEFFRDTEVGDTDNDGVPEILDGWGRPIYFLRWAPGFTSALQTGNAADGSDAFNPLASNQALLAPLVYSAGPDGFYDIRNNGDSSNDPYSSTNGTAVAVDGDGTNYVDNIHSHLVDNTIR